MQQAISTGTVIDKRYQIQKKLPDTTSNQCYLAEDTDQSNRLVLISFPKMELQTLPGFISSFSDACERLIKSRITGLIKALDHGVYESQPYAVLQYVTHETLANVLSSNKLRQKKSSVDDVLDWARPLAVTLDELHEMGFIHSNIRPATIFLGQNRQILLGDFITEFTIQRLGASKQAIASLDIGDHLAPEYIKSNYTESYDQYLLATIVYEALASRSHFHNPGSTEAYRRQVATKFPEPLLNHRPELVGASRILGKALERNPVKRFDSCREFVNQLGSGQVNPVFGGDGDKPVTVIKKVLDFDETAPADPIITSIRSKGSRGKKKGLVWLGVLLLAGGVSAYAVNHFGGMDQFKEKIAGTWDGLIQASDKTPVIIPVDVAPELNQVVEAPNEAPQTDNQFMKSGIASKALDSELKLAGSVSSEVLESDSTAFAIKGNPETSKVINNQDAPEGEEAEQTRNLITDLDNIDAKANSEVDSALSLESIVGQALVEGQKEFNSALEDKKGSTLESVTNNSGSGINDAVNLALQEAQVDFMRKTSPAGLSEDVPIVSVTAEDSLLDNTEADSNEVTSDEAVESAEGNDASPSAAELDAAALNAQMLAASKLADEQAAAAKLAADTKKREQDAQKAQNNAASQVPVKSSGATKTFEEMQQERARLQVLKAEKTARINSITKDCTSSGNIYRQVVKGNLAYVKKCLSVGVDPNLAQSNQQSLLHLASSGGYLNMAKLLVAKGADVNAKSNAGKTPLDLATEKNQDWLATYLRSRGAAAR